MSEQNTNLTEIEETHHVAVEQTKTAMERILNRALENDVDMDRLERLIALREKEIERQNYERFASDLSNMQTEYQDIAKNTQNKHTNSKYASLDQYIDAVKEALAKHNFALFSRIKHQAEKSITIEMTLSHHLGQQISTEGTFPIDGTGSKNSIQSIGSTITYARRYLLGMLLNVASKEDDTDGQTQTKEGDTNNQKVSSKQIKQIEELIKETGTNESSLLYFAEAEKLTDMSCEKAELVLGHLERRKNIQKEKALQSLPPQAQQTAV